MCLTLTIRAPEGSREMLTAAVNALPPSALRDWLTIRRPARLRLPWSRARPPQAGISCLCPLLSESACWDAATWAMNAPACESLAELLEPLARALPGAEVEVLWIGDAPATEQSVTAAELGTLARTSALGTHTRYRIVSETAGGGPDSHS